MLVQQIGPLQVGPLKMLVRQIGSPQNVGAANRAPANCAPGKFPNPVLKLCTHTSNRYISPHPGGGGYMSLGVCPMCRGPICRTKFFQGPNLPQHQKVWDSICRQINEGPNLPRTSKYICISYCVQNHSN